MEVKGIPPVAPRAQARSSQNGGGLVAVDSSTVVGVIDSKIIDNEAFVVDFQSSFNVV